MRNNNGYIICKITIQEKFSPKLEWKVMNLPKNKNYRKDTITMSNNLILSTDNMEIIFKSQIIKKHWIQINKLENLSKFNLQSKGEPKNKENPHWSNKL